MCCVVHFPPTLPTTLPPSAPLYSQRAQIVSGDKEVPLPEGSAAPEKGGYSRLLWWLRWAKESAGVQQEGLSGCELKGHTAGGVGVRECESVREGGRVRQWDRKAA